MGSNTYPAIPFLLPLAWDFCKWQLELETCFAWPRYNPTRQSLQSGKGHAAHGRPAPEVCCVRTTVQDNWGSPKSSRLHTMFWETPAVSHPDGSHSCCPQGTSPAHQAHAWAGRPQQLRCHAVSAQSQLSPGWLKPTLAPKPCTWLTRLQEDVLVHISVPLAAVLICTPWRPGPQSSGTNKGYVIFNWKSKKQITTGFTLQLSVTLPLSDMRVPGKVTQHTTRPQSTRNTQHCPGSSVKATRNTMWCTHCSFKVSEQIPDGRGELAASLSYKVSEIFQAARYSHAETQKKSPPHSPSCFSLHYC